MGHVARNIALSNDKIHNVLCIRQPHIEVMELNNIVRFLWYKVIFATVIKLKLFPFGVV